LIRLLLCYLLINCCFYFHENTFINTSLCCVNCIQVCVCRLRVTIIVLCLLYLILIICNATLNMFDNLLRILNFNCSWYLVMAFISSNNLLAHSVFVLGNHIWLFSYSPFKIINSPVKISILSIKITLKKDKLYRHEHLSFTL